MIVEFFVNGLFESLLHATQVVCFIYFLGLHGVYFTLFCLSFNTLIQLRRNRDRDLTELSESEFNPGVSVIVPAYNESSGIVDSVQSLLQLDYPDYDIVVVNDGSTDDTMEVLIEAFDLESVPQTYQQNIRTQTIQGIYYSNRYENVIVIDKENGGKADALNTGVNVSLKPLVCCVDADSMLEPDSLSKIVQPFLEDPITVGAGGILRISNGCKVENATVTEIGLPKNHLAMIQLVEYLRAFLFGRMGWSPLNALLIVSGAFSIFRRESLIEVGGYLRDNIGEDMELVVRMHRYYRTHSRPYRIVFVPDPVCWTEAPEDLKTLRNQRMRWQRGLMESLSLNRELLLHPKGGLVGWLAFPYMLLFEGLGPIIEVVGMIFMVLGAVIGFVDFNVFLLYLALAVGVGWLLSLVTLLLEDLFFNIHSKPSDSVRLFFACVAETFGFRQLMMGWRMEGVLMWLLGRKAKWGDMKRAQREPASHTPKPKKGGDRR